MSADYLVGIELTFTVKIKSGMSKIHGFANVWLPWCIPILEPILDVASGSSYCWAGMCRPARTWFLKLFLCGHVCVFVCVRVCVCVCMCSPSRLLIPSDVMWHDMDLI